MEKTTKNTPKIDLKSLKQLLNNMKLDEIFENIRQEASAGSGAVAAYIKALFVGSPAVNETNSKRRFEIFKFCITLLHMSDLEAETVTELLSVLLVEVDAFPTSSLIKLAEYLVSLYKQSSKPEGKWLEIIPRVLSTLSVRDTIVYQGIDTSGAELKNLMVKSLCDSEIELSQTATMMLTVILKDVNLTKDEVDLVVSKQLSILPNVSYQEMPTFMYQFLLFSSKGQRKKVLQGIMAYFINEDNKKRAQMVSESEDVIESIDSVASCQAEGSVILLLKVGARQDRGLGKDLVALIKSLQYNPLFCLSPFVFSIALSLACIQRYEEEILDILKAVVLRAYKQKEKACCSAWIRDLLAMDLDVVSCIKNAINNSKHGWDHVGQGLMKFGFLLLDTYGPKLVCGRIPNKVKPHTLTVSEHICSLGCVILRTTFKIHRNVRSEVFEQILTRVITKTSSPVSHYIDVLSQTVQSDPQLLLEILAKLVEVLDYLPFLPYENAVKILKALTPLLKISMPLKDALMLILRKALFHRTIEARKIAISGYATILKRITAVGKLSLSQSQSTMSSQSSTSSIASQLLADSSFSSTSKSESMCLEIMGILKRILMQQAEVKQLLYENLYDVVIKNSSLSDIILELLLNQFEKFYNVADNADFPLNITSCFKTENDKNTLHEPLAHLICAISLILYETKREVNDDDDIALEFDQSAQSMLETSLTNLSTKMSKSETWCPELLKIAETDETPLEEKLRDIIILLMGIYEALMEYCFLRSIDRIPAKNFHASCEELLQLYQKYQSLSTKLQKNKTTSRSSKNKQNIRMPDTFFTIRFFSSMIETLFSEAESEELKLLRSNYTFVKHILNLCSLKLNSYCEQGRSDGFSLHMEATKDYICNIAKFYVRAYSNGLSSSFSSFETWELSSVFIKGLCTIFSYMFSLNERHSSKLTSALSKIIPSASDNGPTRVLKKFQKLTIKALADPEDEEKVKEVIPLLSIITDLCNDPSIYVKEDVYVWVKQLCIEQTFEDLMLVKKLVSLCLVLSHQQKDGPTVLREMSSDIHHHLGDIEPSNTITGRTYYNVVTSKTAPELIILIVHHIEKILVEIDWVLNIMKADALLLNTAIQESLVKESDSFHTKEGNICTVLLDLTNIFNELMQTEIPLGLCSNALLKVCTTIYKTLTVLCKYYLSRYEQKTGYLHPMFPKLVKHSGTHLTTPVYGFITYIQTKETESSTTKKKKSDGTVKIVREIKTIPSLVFSIELYERHLIMLSKKSKKDLMSHIKRSTARDFRIEASTAEAVLNQQDDESILDDDTVGENAENTTVDNNVTVQQDEPAPKKKKLSRKAKTSS